MKRSPHIYNNIITCSLTQLLYFLQDTKTNIYYELGVSTDTPKTPVFLFEDEAGLAFGIITFEEYTNGAPDATKFEVPSICKESQQLTSTQLHQDFSFQEARSTIPHLKLDLKL